MTPGRFVVVVGLALVSSACRETSRQLSDWYDRREGLGSPCAPRTPREVRYEGMALDVPACFEVKRQAGELIVRDPVLRLGSVSMRVRPVVNEGDRSKVDELVARMSGAPGASAQVRGAFRVVRFTRPRGGASPAIVHGWLLASTGLSIAVSYPAPKVLILSPKLRAEMETVNGIVDSIRLAPTSP